MLQYVQTLSMTNISLKYLPLLVFINLQMLIWL